MHNSLKYSNILKVTFPVILSLVAFNIINLTDTIFMGWVGEAELGGSAIGGLFYYGIFVIGFGFSLGSQILISRRNGEGAYSEIGRLFSHSMYFLLLLAAVLVIPAVIFSKAIFTHALSSPAVTDATLQYLNIRIWGIFPAFAGAIFRAFYIGILKPNALSWSAAIMALVNVFLSWAMVFGHWGFPVMGIGGAALASVISEILALIFLLMYSLSGNKLNIYHLRHLHKPDYKLIGHTLKISVFTMLQNFMAMAGWLTFFIIIEQLGERPLAISNIVRSIYIILMIPLWAFGTTTNSLISNLIGEGHKDQVLKALGRIGRLSILSTLAVVIPASIFPYSILGLYTDNMELIRETLPVYYMIMLALLFFALVIPAYSGVTGTGNTLVGMIIEAITIFIYLLFVYIVVIRLRQTVVVAWYSEFVYFIVMGLLSFGYLKFGKWQKIKI